MILSDENLLFDILGRNGEESRQSALDEVMEAFDHIFQPENVLRNIVVPDPLFLSENAAANAAANTGSMAPVFHSEQAPKNIEAVAAVSQTTSFAKNLESLEFALQVESRVKNPESFSPLFNSEKSENSFQNLESFDSTSQFEKAANNKAETNEVDALIEFLAREPKKQHGKLCVRCNQRSRPKHKRCRFCGAKMAPPYIEVKLRKLDDFLRKLLFPA